METPARPAAYAARHPELRFLADRSASNERQWTPPDPELQVAGIHELAPAGPHPAYEDEDEEPSPELLAEWLDKTLTDAEGELAAHQQACGRIGSHWQVSDERLARSCAEVEATLAQLNFRLLRRPGWIARVTGRHRQAQLRFLDQWHDIKVAERRFNAASLGFFQKHMAREATVKAWVLGLEMDSQRLQETLGLAKRCLEALSICLAAQDRGKVPLRALARRAESRLARLARLNAATMGAPGLIRCGGKRASAVIELMQWKWVELYAGWQAGMRGLEGQLHDDHPAPGLAEEHVYGHVELRRLIRHVRAKWAACQRQEAGLLEALSALSGAEAGTPTIKAKPFSYRSGVR